jgi:hypothetical protein
VEWVVKIWEVNMDGQRAIPLGAESPREFAGILRRGFKPRPFKTKLTPRFSAVAGFAIWDMADGDAPDRRDINYF